MNPARNLYRVDMLNVSHHSPMMRALHHPSYVFEKKLSHTADSQDQRHRMVPASRPLMTFADTAAPDVITPRLIRQNGRALEVYRQAMDEAWTAKNRLLQLGVPLEHALYVLPNAKALRLVESGSFLALQHKWTLRTCFNAQEEIYLASMDEIAQVREVHPRLAQVPRARRACCATRWCRRAAPRARTSAACRCGTASPTPCGGCSRRRRIVRADGLARAPLYRRSAPARRWRPRWRRSPATSAQAFLWLSRRRLHRRDRRRAGPGAAREGAAAVVRRRHARQRRRLPHLRVRAGADHAARRACSRRRSRRGWAWRCWWPAATASAATTPRWRPPTTSSPASRRYWNILALYLYAWRLPPTANAAIVAVLVVLVFVPIRYVYPSRTRTWRR